MQYYEYGADTYPSPEQAVRWARAPRGLQPATEIETLSDYRARHALYREDRGLQVSNCIYSIKSLSYRKIVLLDYSDKENGF